MSTTFNKVVETIWRSLLVAAGHTITLTIGGLIVNLAGLSLPAVQIEIGLSAEFLQIPTDDEDHHSDQ